MAFCRLEDGEFYDLLDKDLDLRAAALPVKGGKPARRRAKAQAEYVPDIGHLSDSEPPPKRATNQTQRQNVKTKLAQIGSERKPPIISNVTKTPFGSYGDQQQRYRSASGQNVAVGDDDYSYGQYRCEHAEGRGRWTQNKTEPSHRRQVDSWVPARSYGDERRMQRTNSLLDDVVASCNMASPETVHLTQYHNSPAVKNTGPPRYRWPEPTQRQVNLRRGELPIVRAINETDSNDDMLGCPDYGNVYPRQNYGYDSSRQYMNRRPMYEDDIPDDNYRQGHQRQKHGSWSRLYQAPIRKCASSRTDYRRSTEAHQGRDYPEEYGGQAKFANYGGDVYKADMPPEKRSQYAYNNQQSVIDSFIINRSRATAISSKAESYEPDVLDDYYDPSEMDNYNDDSYFADYTVSNVSTTKCIAKSIMRQQKGTANTKKNNTNVVCKSAIKSTKASKQKETVTSVLGSDSEPIILEDSPQFVSDDYNDRVVIPIVPRAINMYDSDTDKNVKNSKSPVPNRDIITGMSTVPNRDIITSKSPVSKWNVKTSNSTVPNCDIITSKSPVSKINIITSKSPVPKNNIVTKTSPVPKRNVKTNKSPVSNRNVETTKSPMPKMNVKTSKSPVPKSVLVKFSPVKKPSLNNCKRQSSLIMSATPPKRRVSIFEALLSDDEDSKDCDDSTKYSPRAKLKLPPNPKYLVTVPEESNSKINEQKSSVKNRGTCTNKSDPVKLSKAVATKQEVSAMENTPEDDDLPSLSKLVRRRAKISIIPGQKKKSQPSTNYRDLQVKTEQRNIHMESYEDTVSSLLTKAVAQSECQFQYKHLIPMVKAVLPIASDTAIVDKLTQYSGNVELAVGDLLDL